MRGSGVQPARRAIKWGWSTLHYHHLQYPQNDEPGLFATLTNPYAFGTAQVRHVWRTHTWSTLTPEDFEDAAQDALLWTWERRHCAHMTDSPGYISAVIRGKLRRRKPAPDRSLAAAALSARDDACHGVAREQRSHAKGAVGSLASRRR